MKRQKRAQLGGLYALRCGALQKAALPSCEAASAFRRHESGFTLVEVMIGFGVMGILLVTLFGGLQLGFRQISLARENVRATEILEAKMEVIRLYDWDEVVNLPGYIPASFVEPYYANNPTNSSTNGFNYIGTVLVTNAPLTETYASDLRMIQINLTWTSGNVTHNRQMTTFVSQYGLQNYVY